MIAMDGHTTIASLRQQVAKFRDERDWLKFHNPKDLSIALSIESAELQELFLWKDIMDARDVRGDREQFRRTREEVADVLIYLLSLSDILDLDLSEAVTEKLEQNAKKYPIAKSKGSNKKYNVL
jgi:NTP pyrophosphatase (non-canonical NTP hydrolase)